MLAVRRTPTGLLAFAAALFIMGCGKRTDDTPSGGEKPDRRIGPPAFENKGHFQQASIPMDHPWFDESRLQIEVAGALPVRSDQLELIETILSKLDPILERVVLELGQYDEALKEQAAFRRELQAPALFIDHSDARPQTDWAFTVERPSRSPSYGYHVEFRDTEWMDTWAGD